MGDRRKKGNSTLLMGRKGRTFTTFAQGRCASYPQFLPPFPSSCCSGVVSSRQVTPTFGLATGGSRAEPSCKKRS